MRRDDYVGVRRPVTDEEDTVVGGSDGTFPVSDCSFSPRDTGGCIGEHTRLIPKVNGAGGFCLGALQLVFSCC